MPSWNAHVEQRLRTDPLVWLITVRPDGRPNVVPVWFFWDGETFLICSQPKAQKVRNLRHNPHVMLAIDGAGKLGDDVVVVEGTAELLNETSLNLSKANPDFAEKYEVLLQSSHEAGLTSQEIDWQYLVTSYSQPIRVTPTRLLLGMDMQSVSIENP
jgi:PPOX class probable F420-dependent enzyme